MSPKDLLIASVVIVAWGVNFVVVKLGLHGVPPMLLGALRFALAALPAVFIKRPQIPFRWLFAYGITISFGQFALLFYGMSVGMPAGLASLVLQAQAFFTLFFAAMFLGEHICAANLFGLVIAAAGLAVIGMQGGHSMTVIGFLFTLAASSMWALGNVVTKRVGKVELLALVVWGSLIPPIPFLAMSLIFEGPARIESSLANIPLISVFAIAYLSFVATIVGYSLWGKLLARYPAALVMLGLMVNVFGRRIAQRFVSAAR